MFHKLSNRISGKNLKCPWQRQKFQLKSIITRWPVKQKTYQLHPQIKGICSPGLKAGEPTGNHEVTQSSTKPDQPQDWGNNGNNWGFQGPESRRCPPKAGLQALRRSHELVQTALRSPRAKRSWWLLLNLRVSEMMLTGTGCQQKSKSSMSPCVFQCSSTTLCDESWTGTLNFLFRP